MSDESSRQPGYFQLAEWPLHSLVFVLPLMAAYEVGIRWLAAQTPSDAHAQIAASALMRRFFLWFGANGAMLPALAVICILLAWHIVRKEPWQFRPVIYIGMVLESIILTAPLIALGMALPQHLALWSIDPATAQWVVMGLGAGVYEELVFRLIGLTLLSFLLADVLRVAPRPAIVVAIAVSSLAFSLYHYWGHEAFAWRSMVFRTIAGIYFAVLFISRGFGITVGTHAFYDIAVVFLRQFAPGDSRLFS